MAVFDVIRDPAGDSCVSVCRRIEAPFAEVLVGLQVAGFSIVAADRLVEVL